MSLLLYNIFLILYRLGIGIAANFNEKARLWLRGRKDWKDRLTAALGEKKAPVVWMHCASLGEFEQGRPVLEYIRKTKPGYTLVVTFFSPSGYEVRKNYTGADHICYLPLDGYRVAKDFIGIVQPDLVIWVRYEFWYHFLHQLMKKEVPVLLVSGLFRSSQPFFRWYGKLHRHMLSCFRHIFVQDEDSKDLLNSVGFSRVSVSGDTRYDRVSAIAENFQPLPLIEAFVNGSKTVVAGSTWPEDEEELDHFANSEPQVRFIIAPHEIGETHLKEMEKLFNNTVRYGEWEKRWKELQATANPPNVLIIDNIGMLSRLYHYATVAYVGGGFGEDGLHNILEAAVYGVPVIHGPVYDRFPEAIAMLDAGASFAVNNALELESTLRRMLEENAAYHEASAAAETFVRTRKGATNTIINYLEENRLLTN
ncbi:3-deoxy-D-manno-octulosonic acid transferase [Flavihumibacter solisilvae]|uniref:3-deoxy-D-manno-octulosonic acid transferase n=1 Tax=Flavihumibacter solisilvae TaxID=1349421 RepID=A0A0C1IN16_9BACT|nr:glycosyltransferase N-terminal domain-containing protein [Flavihumibacter solisilvae]KIC95620.1 3-deoxy-D-manno-octulosonic acid transferase [Flavihumibacter solisilvae]